MYSCNSKFNVSFMARNEIKRNFVQILLLMSSNYANFFIENFLYVLFVEVNDNDIFVFQVKFLNFCIIKIIYFHKK